MAFNASNLTRAYPFRPGQAGFVGSYYDNPNCPEIWDYDAGSDAMADIEAIPPGAYFPVEYMAFRPGDILRVTASDGKAVYRIEQIGNTGAGYRLTGRKLADVSAFTNWASSLHMLSN